MIPLRYPRIHFSRLPPVFFLCFAALVAVVLTAFVLEQRNRQSVAALLDELGGAYAKMTSARVAQAAANEDLVGMHVLLQDVVKAERVFLAVVHDIDNNIVVQAGNRRQSGLSFSSAVPLNDSIYGYVTIMLEPDISGQQAFQRVLMGVVAILLLMIAMALYECYGDAWYIVTKERRQQKTKPKKPNPDSSEFEREPENIGMSAIGLRVSCANLPQLKRQLSEQRLFSTLQVFEKSLGNVAAVYGGVVQRDGEHYRVSFLQHESRLSEIFNGLCCAQLMKQLFHEQKQKLQGVFVVTESEPGQGESPSNAGVFIECVLADDNVIQRLEVLSVDEEFFQVLDIKGRYRDLLEKQLEQLRHSAS